MRVVNVRDLKDIKFLGKGVYGFVTLVEFEGKKYAYKEFKEPFSDKNTKTRLGDFTDLDFSSRYFTPLYMVEKNNGTVLGYLTMHDENLVSILKDFTKCEQNILIRSAKDAIEVFHDDYNYVHGDAHLGNVLCHKRELISSLIDFDLSLKIGENPLTFDDYKEVIQDYLKYYPFDKNVDVYLFNLSTLHILSHKEHYDDYSLLEAIEDNTYELLEMNKDVKRLSKELLLQDTRNPYSGEYIIDYIDKFEYNK